MHTSSPANDNNVARRPLRILYYGAGWSTNIGNAFIDLGALALLRSAAPDSHIAFASEMPRWFALHPAPGRRQLLLSTLGKHLTPDSALDVAAVTECDWLVFAGMAMCKDFIDLNGPTVLEQSRRGVHVLLLGTGAQEYSETERDLYRSFLKLLRPVAFVSRDDRSFDMFADVVHPAYRGIDCAFFLPEAYTPLPVSLPPYVVAACDSGPEPSIPLNGRLLVSAHHKSWGPAPRVFLDAERVLISDIPHDYLTLYANADEVHTDRVHASIATLAYGGRTRLYHATPRRALFDAVGAGRIREELVQLDMLLLSERKNRMLELVKRLLCEPS